jgi:glycerophosphoryl diester phosphodiesterase
VKRRTILLCAIAAAAVGLSLLNASWLAPIPTGRLTLVAHRGIAQPLDPAKDDVCGARRIAAGGPNYIENTLFSMQGAMANGARGLALDVRTSADGQAVIFRDAELDCRTNGSGPVRARTLAELKRLDMGYGYSADGGATFPLRGRGIGAMPTAAELIRTYPRDALIFELHDDVAAEALVAAFREAGLEIGAQHGFAGTPERLARLRRLTSAGWVLDVRESEACLAGYRRTGWLGLVPDSCRGATLDLPRGGGFTLWGWPYRFFDRMAGAEARLLIQGDRSGDELHGLDRAEQLGEVPHDYRGLLLVEDMWQVGRALD